MSKTTNYQLTLWDYADEDFSPKQAREGLAANFTKLDAALTGLAGGIVEAKKRLRIVVGSYQGDGQNSQFINLGATPKAVWMVQKMASGYTYHGLIGAGLPDENAKMATNGFTVSGFLNYDPGTTDGVRRNPYRYLAFFWTN